MRKAVRFEGHMRLIRIGRDGKNRYCLYYNVHHLGVVPPLTKRTVIAGGLTKLAAYRMFDLLEK